VAAQSIATARSIADLKKSYANKQYFELRDQLKEGGDDKSVDLLFYRGVVNNKFNRPNLSITYFREYLKQARERSDPEMLIQCYEMLADDYRKTYQYRRAAETYTALLTKFAHKLDASKKSDLENAVKLWRALSNVPRQTIVMEGDSVIKKDQEGHFPLEINHRKVSFIFDTGANLSVVTSSLAKRLALNIIDASINVLAVAGNTVKARLAVARSMRIGKADIHNAVFLVFDDKDLYISESSFQINGLIGFPIIEALREVAFVHDREIHISATAANGGEQNMCFDGLSPLIAGWFKDKRLIFALDTGATRSTLFPPFYEQYEDMIKTGYQKYSERVRGVGGYKEIRAYLAKNVVMTFSGKDAHFAQIPILIEHTTDKSHYFYGNLGQDLIKQFERMTLNFETMNVVFE